MRSAIPILACTFLVAAAAPAWSASPADLVPARIKNVVVVNDSPAVLLVDQPEHRYLLVYVDMYMATAIRMGMIHHVLSRPLTHDLMNTLLKRLGARVTRVAITDLKDNTYYALIFLEVNGRTLQVDARPSDALALAVRSGASIRVAARLLTKVAPPPPAPKLPPPGPATPDQPPAAGAPLRTEL